MWNIYYTSTIKFTKLQLGWKKKFSTTLKSYDIVFRPLIQEISAKEEVIREYADAATMGRVRRMLSLPFFSLFCSSTPHTISIDKI